MATVKKFNLVCILETDSNELEKNLKFLDSFKGLKTALNDGISSILLKTGKDKINLLSSILGFSETLLSNPDFIQKGI